MSASATSSNRFPELDKYELLEEIGHGGMATVYRAKDQRLEREVAVKIIHKHLRENAEVRRRFVAEARAVAKLRHPGIVEVFDVSNEEDEERYLVVELIRGMSLRQLLQERTMLPPEIAATMVALLCDAVEHAHQTGVIHRDIKPENVLLELPERGAPSLKNRGEGERITSDKTSLGSSARSGGARVIVKLTDFGIAKVLDVQGVTSTGQILGSPAHMAPEQIEGGDVGPHTDVFALGVLMYECMVGHLPFEGRNPAQVLRRVLEGDFDAADGERAEVGGRWARIIAAALAKDIEARVPTSAKLGAMIEAELGALGIEDARADMVDYFVDPEAYGQKVRAVMVPRLLARGELEKKNGHVPDAAADFNRALALCPDDLAILKRVSALTAETVWRERATRIGAIVLGSALLGGAAFGVTRVVREEPAANVNAAPTTTAPAPAEKQSSTLPSSELSVAPVPETDSSGSPDPDPVAVHTSQPGPVGSVEPEPGSGELQWVVLRIFPAVQVTFAGVPRTPNVKFQVAPGTHAYSVENACCKPKSGSFTVNDDENPDNTQPLGVTLELKDALLSLTGAESGGSMSCTGGVNVTGAAVAVAMDALTKQLQCTFSPSGKTMPVQLRAGAQTQVPYVK